MDKPSRLFEYERLYRRSIEEPEAFWAEQAGRHLILFKPSEWVLTRNAAQKALSQSIV